MISCDTFRTRFEAATEDPALLEHIRACDACLDSAASIDPDIMFRALGGSEMIPPGGVDAFVSDVMREVRLRSTENRMADASPQQAWWRKLAVAAVLVGGMSGSFFYYQRDRAAVSPSAPASVQTMVAPVQPINFTNKPVVEQYDSDRATIVEMPTNGADVAVVMVFDENLPADL